MADAPLNAGALSTFLDADETVEHRIVSHSGPVEREIDGSVSMLSPAGDYGSVLVATSARVLVIVGGGDRGGEDAVYAVQYPEVADVTVNDGLLHNEIVVETEDGEVYRISPDEGDMQSVASYVRSLADTCDSIETLVDKAELTSKDVDTDPDLAANDIESTRTEVALERAFDTLSDLDVAVVGGLAALQERIEKVWLGNYVSRGMKLKARGSEAAEDGRIDEAARFLKAALESYEAAASIATEREFRLADEICRERDDVAGKLQSAERRNMTRAHEAVERATDADGEEAASAWVTAYDEYGEALDGEWVEAPVAVDDHRAAIRYQRAWVAANAVDTLRTLAEDAVDRAEAAPAGSDRAVAAFESAEQHLEPALRIAEEQGLPTSDLRSLRGSVRDAIEMAQWEWGGTG